ncbi:MAG: divalent-cation tolerance protein CutA [Bacteroidota bacterium]|jgi:periplasmic divalent cation tolerance protein
MEKAQEIRIVFVTAKTSDSALQISRILVNENLAACCSVIHNVSSVFGWQGAVNERTEYLIIIKTAEPKINELEKRITELHPDEVPEIISVAVDSGKASYLDWIKQSLLI